MVDNPTIVGSGTMWVWASAELGEDLVWVSEEAVNMSRTADDLPWLDYTLDLKQPKEPLLAGYGVMFKFTLFIVSFFVRSHNFFIVLSAL